MKATNTSFVGLKAISTGSKAWSRVVTSLSFLCLLQINAQNAETGLLLEAFGSRLVTFIFLSQSVQLTLNFHNFLHILDLLKQNLNRFSTPRGGLSGLVTSINESVTSCELMDRLCTISEPRRSWWAEIMVWNLSDCTRRVKSITILDAFAFVFSVIYSPRYMSR
jgi:hypothetical protein